MGPLRGAFLVVVFVFVFVVGGCGACGGLPWCCPFKVAVLRLDSACKMAALEALSSAVAR